jgi:CRISPR-associated endonuclease/helicase Cas3
MASHSFDAFFHAATGHPPYDFQRRLASEPVQSHLVHIPTGAGKTAAAILAWLWRLKVDRNNTPRRLIYCLPMRTFAKETWHCGRRSVENLKKPNGLMEQIGSFVGKNRCSHFSTQPRIAVWLT